MNTFLIPPNIHYNYISHLRMTWSTWFYSVGAGIRPFEDNVTISWTFLRIIWQYLEHTTYVWYQLLYTASCMTSYVNGLLSISTWLPNNISWDRRIEIKTLLRLIRQNYLKMKLNKWKSSYHCFEITNRTWVTNLLLKVS